MNAVRVRHPRVAARPDIREVGEASAALQALLAKARPTDHTFAANLQAIALEIGALGERNPVGRSSQSLNVAARRLRWLAWSGGGNARTTAALLKIATDMEKEAKAGARRLAVRKSLWLLAVTVALAIVACGVYLAVISPPSEAEEQALLFLPPPTTPVAPAQREPAIAETLAPNLAASPRPEATVARPPVAKAAPAPSVAVAEPKAAAPQSRRAGRSMVAEKAAATPSDPRDCTPTLADATLSDIPFNLVCGGGAGQWHRKNEPPPQQQPTGSEPSS